MIGPFEEPEPNAEELKNSKIVQRKQIQKRLQGLKPTEYEKIIENLTSQNEKLKLEVKNINGKVEELMQARKMVKHKNPQIEGEIMRLKKQLDLKYESMSYLKESVKKLSQSEMTEEMKLKIQERTNIIMQCQMQFRQLEKQRENIRAQIQHNQEDTKEFIPNDTSDGRIESLKGQNKELKHKIMQLKEKLKYQERNSKEMIGKLYNLKDEEKRDRGLANSNREISMSLKQIKSTSLSQIAQLQRQISGLKNKKKEVERDITTDKIIKEAKRNKTQKQIKDLLEYHKQLYKRRVKGVNQLNYYEQRQIQLEEQLKKEEVLGLKNYEEAETQTIKVVPLQFRKEWFGKGEGTPFSDANAIQFRGESLIKAATVYKTPQNIVWIKFHYESPQKKKYESEPPFEKFVLKKCEARKYESKTLAPLSNMTVSAHSALKKVVKVQFKWSDGESSVIGWDIDGSTKYPFDIKDNERPVCMFGTINTIGKFSYVLESLGCEVNTIDY